MGYYGMDIEAALAMAGRLRRIGGQAEVAAGLFAEAELLADLVTPCRTTVAEVAETAVITAAAIEAAARALEAYRLSMPVPWSAAHGLHVTSAGASRSAALADSPGQPVAQLAESPDRPLNDLRQIASHNTYRVPGGIDAHHELGVHAVELDIHRGAPTDLGAVARPFGLATALGAVLSDHFDHRGAVPEDWLVYHHSLDPVSEYERLSDGLRAAARVAATGPLVTVFVDNKDGFGGAHTPAAFDQLLDDVIGDQLYGPAELAARVPGASTPREAIERDGWPTADELDGRVMVVMTDDFDGYPRASGRAFVAPPPAFGRAADGRLVHLPEAGVVFYNVDSREVGTAELDAVHAGGSIIRTYFNRPCRADGDALPNFRAIDIVDALPVCSAAAG